MLAPSGSFRDGSWDGSCSHGYFGVLVVLQGLAHEQQKLKEGLGVSSTTLAHFGEL